MNFPSVKRRLPALLLATIALGACSDDDDNGLEPLPELTAPTNVSVTSEVEGDAATATITWDAVDDADSYIVQRAAGAAGGTFLQIGDPVAATTMADESVDQGTTYRWRVAARRGTEVGAFSAERSLEIGTAGPKVRTIAANITSDLTLYADTVYTISGFIKVANGATLTIEAGTTILGDYEVLGSSLFVLRGARIRALGTPEAPIVFTSERPVGERKPGDWGGLVILGNGRVNRGDPTFLEGTGTNEVTNPSIDYAGGTDNADDSGELRYVRVEFAGFAPAPNQELNSFTFAAVGSGTDIEGLQSLAGLDDSFEWFGGAVDGKYLVSYESGDDHFDASEGYQGRNQFLIAFQSKVLTPRPEAGAVSGDPQGFEVDGCSATNCTSGETSEPFNIPVFANFTMIGTGPGVVDANNGGFGLVLRRGTGGFYVNGILARWPKTPLSLRDAATQARFTAGDAQIGGILLASNGAAQDNATTFESGTGRFTIDEAANAIVKTTQTAASLVKALPTDPTSGAQFDWQPPAASPAASGGMATFAGSLATRAGTFVTATDYRGAADPDGRKWWAGWTSYADN
jgi:hypothetical protein